MTDAASAAEALTAAKAAMRAEALARRPALVSPGAGEALATHFLARSPLPPGATIAGFWPMGDEIDIRPLLHELHARGHPLLLPATPPRGQALRFRRWAPGVPLLRGPFGTQHPAGPGEATPDLLLVPLLAFDARGHRLGYGAGYYDRTLAAWPQAGAIGIAYSGQEVSAVPHGPHDIPLHAIATELGFRRVVAGLGQD